ncbi:hypothetical protein KCP73_01275 [Salmonella enterica subsp. enterica]|nr:hypothetical protein KCP73_01275 [Salmonella enterica subsp. enterica]
MNSSARAGRRTGPTIDIAGAGKAPAFTGDAKSRRYLCGEQNPFRLRHRHI